MTHPTKSFLAAVAAAALAACSGGGDDASPRPTALYGTTYNPGGSELLQLDPNTGAYLQTIGPVGYMVNGLEYDHTTGKLYATTSGNDPSFPRGLIEIDLLTGAGTPIGSGTGLTIMNPTVNSAGDLYAWSEDTDDLVRVDKVAGTATVVGDSTLDTYEHGLAFDTHDRLIFFNGDGYAYQLDTTTGAATLVAQLAMRAHHGDFHPGTGLYWGIDETANTAPDEKRTFRIVSLAAKTITFGVPTADDLFAITFK